MMEYQFGCQHCFCMDDNKCLNPLACPGCDRATRCCKCGHIAAHSGNTLQQPILGGTHQ